MCQHLSLGKYSCIIRKMLPCGEGSRFVKKHWEICLMILITFLSLAFLLGFFVLRNRGENFCFGNLFSHKADIVHTQPAASGPTGKLININTATAAQLQTLPGIGPGLAQKIIAFREENGPFATPAELAKVPGIGIHRLETLLAHITTGG